MSESAPDSERERPAFDISPQVVFRLGDELITDELQALIELVKNSYDASAERVGVVIDTRTPAPGLTIPASLTTRGAISDPALDGSVEEDSDDAAHSDHADTQSAGADAEVDQEALVDLPALGWLEVADDGDGMTRERLENGWLLISSSSKRVAKAEGRKNRAGRTPLGDKGLGRLGVLRLGVQVEIRTRPREEAEEHILRFQRSDFEKQNALSDVDLHYEVRELVKHERTWRVADAFVDDVSCSALSKRQGTVIRVTGLINPEVWNDTQTVQEEMLSLYSPFEEIEKFSLSLRVNEDLVPMAELVELRRDLANARWRLEFDGQVLSLDGRLKLRAFEPASSNERLSRLWEQLIVPDGGAALRQRLLTGALKGVAGRAGDPPYWLAVSTSVRLSEIPDPAAKRRRSKPEQASARRPRWVSPGPFVAEIDSYDLAASAELGVLGRTLFTEGSDYRDWVRQVRGVKVFRDGFGVRVGDDFLKLGVAFTSARGFYALRPGNVVGFVSISASENSGLQETTDREGFVVNAPYRAFDALLRFAVERINYVQNAVGRSLGTWADESPLPQPPRLSRTAAELARHAAAQVQRTSQAMSAVDSVQNTLESLSDGGALLTPEQEQATQKAAQVLTQLRELTDEWAELEAELASLAERSQRVEHERAELRDQLRVAYQTVGLGIVAETVAHEMDNITGRLQAYAKHAAPKFKGTAQAPGRALLVEIDRSVRDIRQQIRHLEPQLRYQRARRSKLDVLGAVSAAAEYHLRRFGPSIAVVVSGPSFTVQANEGRLRQALDNLFINSEFWLQHSDVPEPRIDIIVQAPTIRFRDNGPGVDPVLAPAIFEPFVSGRSGEQGRGLGLFITRQVLQDDGATIYLSPSEEPDKRQREFVIDLSGALEAKP